MTDFPLAPVWVASTVTLGKMLQPNQEFGDDLLCKYVYAGKIGTNGLLNEDSEAREMWFTPSELQRLSLREGDSLVTEGGDVGRPAFIGNDLPGVGFQNSVIRLRPKLTTHPKYLYYAMDYLYRSGHVDRVCSAVSLKHFTAEKVAVQSIPLPDFETQRRIADYLDKETGEMDAMIREFDGLVRNLQARKPMLIDNLLAGFPVAPLALSWKVVDCLHITAPFIDSGENYLVSIEQLGSENLILDGANRTDGNTFSKLREGERKPSPGDVIMSRNASVGKSSIVKESDPPIALGQDVVIFKNNDKNDSRLLYYFLQSNALMRTVEMNTVGSTLKRINVGSIKSLPYPVLALEKQQLIAEQLQRETAKMDALIEESTRLIENLKARKTALITEVVTGRKEV